MISVYKLFTEAPNVPNGQANGLTAPFGVIDPSERNRKLLADAQGLSMKDPHEQVNWMNKVLK